MSGKHTATPWKVYRTTDGLHMLGIGQASTGDGITDPRFGLWCSDAERDANAAFIVRACNSHDSLVKALERLLGYVERNTCQHDETHRGGVLWEICDQCGAKWADDVGGKPKFKWHSDVTTARAALSQAKGGK